MVGNNMMSLASSSTVTLTGFVSEEEKEQLLKQAEALVIPSVYESLSLALLESFACKVPVIANGNTQVLKDHIDLSGGGWCYNNEKEFNQILKNVTKGDYSKIEKGTAGYNYVLSNYTWNKVLQTYHEAIEDCKKLHQ